MAITKVNVGGTTHMITLEASVLGRGIGVYDGVVFFSGDPNYFHNNIGQPVRLKLGSGLFVDEDDPNGGIRLKITNGGLFFNPNGELGLKLGSGLALDTDGNITVTR